MISENLKCEISEQISETSLNFYFRKKLLELREHSCDLSHFRHSNSIEALIIYYRCHKIISSNCKSKYMIIFDKKNKLANIYHNEEKHNHTVNNRFIHLRKKKIDVI